MNLKPLGDNIVVKPAKAEEQTKSGLIIPETAKDCLLYTSPSPRD